MTDGNRNPPEAPFGQSLPHPDHNHAEESRGISTPLVKLWLAQFISKAGDQLFIIAGAFLVLRLSASETGLDSGATTRAGMMEAARALPALVLGLFAGALADRMDRRVLMVVSDLARAALLAALVAVYALGGLQWWMLPVGAFLLSSFSCAFEPARDAFLPQIVPRSGLFRANSLFQTSMPLAVVFGSLVIAFAGYGGRPDAGIDKPISPLVAMIGIDAASFVLSALLILAIPRRAISPVTAPAVGQGSSLAAHVGEVLALAKRDRRLAALLLLTAANNLFLMGPATVGAAILFERDLARGDWAVAAFGIFEACMAAGLLCGLFWVLKFGHRWPRGKLLLTGLVMDGVTYVPFLFMGRDAPDVVYFGMILFHGFFIPWIIVPRTSLVQELWPGAIQGRIFAFVALTVTGFHALSALLTGWAAEYLSAQVLYAIGGGGAALVGAVGFASATLRNIGSPAGVTGGARE